MGTGVLRRSLPLLTSRSRWMTPARSGVHWTEYPAGADGKPLTAREAIYGAGQKHLRDDHYGSRFSWNKGEEPPALD